MLAYYVNELRARGLQGASIFLPHDGARVWFSEETTEAGREALGYYHERKDERRDIGLGPEHDWSSHAADAFGLMAVCAEEPGTMRAFNRKIEYPKWGVV